MKIYYSNMSSVKLDKNDIPPIGVLVSYYGIGNVKKPEYSDSLFLDSGAFSAWNQNINIDVYDYIQYVQDNGYLFDVVASLDDIGSDEISMHNYFEMKKADLNPLPCFHYGEPFSVLDEYTKHTNYIAIGGIAKINKRDRIIFLNNIFSKYPKVEDVGFHGFGIQDRSILLNYPWKSVDASSAHIMARFGGICTPWGDIKINIKVQYHGLRWMTPKSEEILKNWVKDMGEDYDEAKEQTTEGLRIRCIINVKYYEQLAKNHIKIFNKKKMQKVFF